MTGAEKTHHACRFYVNTLGKCPLVLDLGERLLWRWVAEYELGGNVVELYANVEISASGIDCPSFANTV